MPASYASFAMRNGLSRPASTCPESCQDAVGSWAGGAPAAVATMIVGCGVVATADWLSPEPQGRRITSHATPTAAITPPATQSIKSPWLEALLPFVAVLMRYPTGAS